MPAIILLIAYGLTNSSQSPPKGYQEGQSMSPTMFNFSSQTQIQAGLEALAPLDACVVHQKMETLELVTDYETSNSYEIKNVLGATIFVAVEGKSALPIVLFN